MNPKSRIALGRAKKLRRVMTDAEKELWYHLRAHRLFGTKFKRQKPIGPYIADFACPALRLVIEIDGGQHSEEVKYDRLREIWLHKRGYTVLRFWNNEVMENMEGVLERIAAAVKNQAPSPLSPSPASGRGATEITARE
ncbi:MAG: endonuclease domain-containing protein [Sulfuricaulis sp.]